MAIIAIGIDLAKNVFAVHGVDASGKAVRPAVRRDALLGDAQQRRSVQADDLRAA